MKRKFVPVALAAVMAFNLAACNGGGTTPTNPGTTDPGTTDPGTTDPGTADPGTTDPGTPDEDVEPYPVRTNADGSPIDLGGMEIVIRDWFSNEDTDIMQIDPDKLSSYESEIREYREWAMEKYNFKMRYEITDGYDWGTAPAQMLEYVQNGGDANNYIFVVRDDISLVAGMKNGQMYDLSTLDCLDFSDAKFTKNKCHELYSLGGGTYAMYAGLSEPRCGVYFNKTLLEAGGHTADEIYDLQKEGKWTWDAWESIMKDCQKDNNGDGVIDVYGWTANTGGMWAPFVFSNGGELIGQENGKYVLKVADEKTVEGLEQEVRMIKEYREVDPEGSEWDYYKQGFQNGEAVFLVEDEYAGTPGNFLENIEFECGFVMFPAGPKGTMTNKWSNNPAMIPGVYDADRAWNIAFAYDVWTEIPGDLEEENGFVSRARSGIFDQRALDETLPMMSEADHGMISFDGMIADLEVGPQFSWGINGDTVVSELVDSVKDMWQGFVDAANN